MVLYRTNGPRVEFGELEEQSVPGSAEGEIRLRRWLEDEGHESFTTTDRKGGELEQNLQDAHVLIIIPFWPVYATREMMENASILELILTAGVGSTHIDLATAENHITVTKRTNSNVVSVAGHAVMRILNLVRNFVPQYYQVINEYYQVINGEWSIAGTAERSYDLEGKSVSIYGAGAISQLVAMRLKPFDVKMYYYKSTRLSDVEEEGCGLCYTRLDDMLKLCDVVVIEAPLTPETEGLFDRHVLFNMKKGNSSDMPETCGIPRPHPQLTLGEPCRII